MREVVLGTAGHVDHGKTSLVRALTGIDTDRLKEEKARGITIELGFAHLDLPCGHRLGIIDVPGHERFVKNMVAGAAGVDLVAFVIAADEGVMPQTLEHFEICKLLGVQQGLVIITKKDMVDSEWLELVQDDVKQFLAGSFLEDAPMFAVSSTTGEGIEAVRDELDQLVAKSDLAEAHGPFRLAVDRIFTMKGFGAVVTGTSISGRIAVGDDVLVYPQELGGKIRGIQVHGNDVQEVEAGHRTAINIQGIDKELISRGNMLATSGCLKPSYMLDAEFLYLSGNKKPFKNRARVRVHLGTAEVMGRVLLLDDEEALPGSTCKVQLLLEEPVTAWPGDRYVVRSYSPVYTIGGGAVLNGVPLRKRRRFKAENNEVFKIFLEGESEELAQLHLRESGFAGLTFDELAVRLGLFGKRLKKILSGPLSARKILVVDSDKQRMIEESVFGALTERVATILTAYHAENPMKSGLAKEELRFQLQRGLDQRLFQMVLNDLVKSGVIVQAEAEVRLAGHEVSFKEDEESLRQDMEQLYSESGLKPPTIKEVISRFDKVSSARVREMLTLLVREKKVVKITEDLHFHATILDGLVEQVRDYCRGGELDAQSFKVMTGLTRKFSIPLLEYFDKIKLTIRVGDKRILRERQV
ncbi:MAG: selenocysteine-specific translation elongation factor [Desulfobulbaceae bacterium]|nr:selenocysteine-specific translation elongation factor [Desulfobulbaceae bacterium]